MWGSGLYQSLERFVMGLHEQRSIALMNRRYLVAKYKSFGEPSRIATQKRGIVAIFTSIYDDHWDDQCLINCTTNILKTYMQSILNNCEPRKDIIEGSFNPEIFRFELILVRVNGVN